MLNSETSFNYCFQLGLFKYFKPRTYWLKNCVLDTCQDQHFFKQFHQTLIGFGCQQKLCDLFYVAMSHRFVFRLKFQSQAAFWQSWTKKKDNLLVTVSVKVNVWWSNRKSKLWWKACHCYLSCLRMEQFTRQKLDWFGYVGSCFIFLR